MPITIRKETEQDYFASENCCRNAFWNVYTQGCYEHFLVHTMRSHRDFIPELSFVPEYEKGLSAAFTTHILTLYAPISPLFLS